MYEQEINQIDVSFIFYRKPASRECVLQGPKILKSISVVDGGRSHVSGYMANDF